MGGNLFHFGRLPAAGYWPLEERVRCVLSEFFGPDWRIPFSHRDKLDFGDLDVLVSADILIAEAVQQVQTQLDVQDVKRVKNVYSLAVPLLGQEQQGGQTHFQVDLFATPPQELQVRHQFMSWGDCGNIIARLGKAWNLKWGEDGLWYVHRREGDEQFRAELLLSRDIHDLLRVLELNAEVYDAGFPSERAMFEWVMASPQFTARPYLQQEGKMKHKARSRPGMQRFCKLVAERYGPAIPPKTPARDPMEFFPEVPLWSWRMAQDHLHYRRQLLKEKFNGSLVQAWRPDLSGPALGEFMRAVRIMRVEGQPFEDWVLQAELEVIRALVQEVR